MGRAIYDVTSLHPNATERSLSLEFTFGTSALVVSFFCFRYVKCQRLEY